ncbi:aftiphilin a isoform X2 [Antennarius striatus]|uniref:aftiphilin a isoform X2 n=1 Tax=Antennarius striatus TaxID=241820 RepID=UPI0035ADED28
MEPDVVRMYSSSPPPMDDGAEEDESEFGDFGTFSSSGVPNSISFTEFDTPTTFNQSQALTATSPPELLHGRGGAGFGSSNGAHRPGQELPKANGVAPEKHPGGGGPSERTEARKAFGASLGVALGNTGVAETGDCNGGGAEVLTNGFAPFGDQGSPLQNSVQSHPRRAPAEDAGAAAAPQDDFADFAAFSNTEGQGAPSVDADRHAAQGTPLEDAVRDASGTGADTPPGAGSTPVSSEAPDESCDTDWGPPSPQGGVTFAQERLAPVCTDAPVCLNGGGAADEAAGGSDTETETSFGRVLSTDALEEYGDMSTTGSAPSPSPLGEPPLPPDLSQPPDDDDDFGRRGFADFDHPPATQEAVTADDSDDFGDFNAPQLQSDRRDGEGGGAFAEFPPSDSFGNFSAAAEGEADAGWRAFGEQQVGGESWAAFSTETMVLPPGGGEEEEGEEEEEEEEEWHESEPPAVSEETSRTDRQPASLSGRLEKLFQSSFPQGAVASVGGGVTPLEVLLGRHDDAPAPRVDDEKKEEEGAWSRRCPGRSVWTQLRDVNEAVGLRYQWGGSHCNKTLLCCLGIDTRNILFTGQKKQPVIVPMYAASLGMLEPTKEPVKPISAAEMIASIGQAPPLDPEGGSCPSDSVQEALPPVQFDWSSSGLTNPLDGVDPELFELTTSKLDSGGAGSRVADAFARLMSTMEKTSTSTRKPRKEENLSEEAAKVIAALPDLSFMQAKVLMFPATLTPIGSQATPD